MHDPLAGRPALSRNCPSREQLEPALDERPVPPEIETHLAGCSRCRSAADEVRRLDSLLRAALALAPRPPRGCLSIAEVCAFVERRLPESWLPSVEAHLAACAMCRAQVMAVADESAEVELVLDPPLPERPAPALILPRAERAPKRSKARQGSPALRTLIAASLLIVAALFALLRGERKASEDVAIRRDRPGRAAAQAPAPAAGPSAEAPPAAPPPSVDLLGPHYLEQSGMSEPGAESEPPPALEEPPPAAPEVARAPEPPSAPAATRPTSGPEAPVVGAAPPVPSGPPTVAVRVVEGRVRVRGPGDRSFHPLGAGEVVRAGDAIRSETDRGTSLLVGKGVRVLLTRDSIMRVEAGDLATHFDLDRGGMRVESAAEGPVSVSATGAMASASGLASFEVRIVGRQALVGARAGSVTCASGGKAIVLAAGRIAVVGTGRPPTLVPEWGEAGPGAGNGGRPPVPGGAGNPGGGKPGGGTTTGGTTTGGTTGGNTTGGTPEGGDHEGGDHGGGGGHGGGNQGSIGNR